MDDTENELLTVERELLGENIVILKMSGELDLATVHLLSGQLKSVAEGDREAVIIDATQVGFMDSTGLHALVEGKRQIHEAGKRIFLVPSNQVRRVLELVFPDRLFADRLDDIEQAIEAAT
ncbi:MAG TPA: STAS domain-containing protein [Acidimicrobiia bacterium]|jgi:anti-anti-sigma factor|nr:STAS domain-containing protein [Acidimicrobiia bacterium]